MEDAMREWQLWEAYFEIEERVLEDGLTMQSSDITDFLEQRCEAAIKNIMALGYSREAIEEYGTAWLQLTQEGDNQ